MRTLRKRYGRSAKPSYDHTLDRVLDGLQVTDKIITKAHQQAPNAPSKAILVGLHQDLFQTTAEFRKYIRQLKALE